MIQVAVELVEPVHREVFILVAQVILSELAGGITLCLEHLGDRRVFLAHPQVGPGSPTLLRPVRKTLWPVMNAERPAVQLCSP